MRSRSKGATGGAEWGAGGREGQEVCDTETDGV